MKKQSTFLSLFRNTHIIVTNNSNSRYQVKHLSTCRLLFWCSAAFIAIIGSGLLFLSLHSHLLEKRSLTQFTCESVILLNNSIDDHLRYIDRIMEEIDYLDIQDVLSEVKMRDPYNRMSGGSHE
ncbi:hypothetical protein ACFL6I_02130 [candidate division KSB1 bacterium]